MRNCPPVLTGVEKHPSSGCTCTLYVVTCRYTCSVYASWVLHAAKENVENTWSMSVSKERVILRHKWEKWCPSNPTTRTHSLFIYIVKIGPLTTHSWSITRPMPWPERSTLIFVYSAPRSRLSVSDWTPPLSLFACHQMHRSNSINFIQPAQPPILSNQSIGKETNQRHGFMHVIP